jgi:tRNA threonylcarbamoyladenosine biosynthesis protein TsaE
VSVARLHSSSVEETEALGERLGAALRVGDFVGLIGGLGAGKTAFARGVSRGAKIPTEAQVSSPTFAIVNAYRGGAVPLFHADLYRVKDAEELYDMGFDDLIDEGALLVEWIDRVPSAAPVDWLEIRFTRVGVGRELELVPHGPRAEALSLALSAGSAARP